MKRALYLLIAFVLPLFCLANNNAETYFAAGNAAYAKGHFKEALESYQKVLNDNYQSASLYLNMGNASYKNGDVPSALLYYGKAHKLAPGDEDINFNIRFVNSKTTDKVDAIPEFFLSRWWHGFILAFSAGALAWLSILLVVAASATLVWYFYAQSVLLKKVSFYGAIILFFLGLFTVFIAGSQLNYFNGHKEAIIFNSSVTVKSGPVDKAGALFVIHDGTKVNVLDSNNGWTKIKLNNGNEGWIKSTDAKEI
jgi:tetratricopeptide (TPR) repeat protein